MTTQQLPDHENTQSPLDDWQEEPESTRSLLDDWQEEHDAIERVMTDIEAVFGLDPGCPLNNAVWSLFEAYTETLAVEIGDMGGWMLYYWRECRMGKQPLGGCCGRYQVKIETLDDLWLLIEKFEE